MSTTSLSTGSVAQVQVAVPAVPLLDVACENAPRMGEIQEALARVCRSGQFILGPDCQQLETSIAELCGTRHAIGCASGSDALLLALMALEIGPGDEVIVPSFTFFATASAAWRLGARPVFADIDPESFNLDPAAVRACVGVATRAIIPVHLFGQCAQMDQLAEVARRHDLRVVEDCAQAIGARFAGRPAGSLGAVGCFSFYPTKNLGGFGDGGILTTSDDAMAERLRLLRGHGMQPRYHHAAVGINSRLDSLQAAVLNVKLPHLAQQTAARRENAARYQQLFTQCGLERVLGLPSSDPRGEHVWNQYTIRVPGGHRDRLRQHLAQASIGSEVYYPIPLHLQPCFRNLGYGVGSLPHTERAATEVLSLPIFPGLTGAQQARVVRSIAQFFGVPARGLA